MWELYLWLRWFMLACFSKWGLDMAAGSRDIRDGNDTSNVSMVTRKGGPCLWKGEETLSTRGVVTGISARYNQWKNLTMSNLEPPSFICATVLCCFRDLQHIFSQLLSPQIGKLWSFSNLLSQLSLILSPFPEWYPVCLSPKQHMTLPGKSPLSLEQEEVTFSVASLTTPSICLVFLGKHKVTPKTHNQMILLSLKKWKYQ